MGAGLADLKVADTALRNATRQSDQIKNQLKLLEEQEQKWHKTRTGTKLDKNGERTFDGDRFDLGIKKLCT